MDLNKTIAVIGLGLIGGSIAKGLKKQKPEIRIKAYDYGNILDKAFEDGTIDEKLATVEDAANSDIVFLCLPTSGSIAALEKLAPVASGNVLITDVGGVKSVFYEKWQTLSGKASYVGGHPMTGKEKGGYENSDPLLFESAVYILAQSECENPNFDVLKELIKLLGARIKFVDPYLHDKIIGYVSHLPQLASVCLVNAVNNKNNEVNFLDFAAGGFRDMTRIASSNFDIWEPVIKQNKEFILQSLDSLQKELLLMRQYVEKENYADIEKMFNSARKKRDEIPKNTKGFLNPLYEIYVYVKDEPGVLSKLTTVLFQHNISIKDLELLKIREGTGGTFRLSLESEQDAQNAKLLIENLGFATK
mgnify:CR=1 FL=1